MGPGGASSTHTTTKGSTGSRAATPSGGSGLGAAPDSAQTPQQPGVSNSGGTFSAQTASVSKRSGVSGGALFGGTSSLIKEEPKLGRKLAIVRVYYRFGQHFPRRSDAHAMAGGRTLLLSLDLLSRKLNYKSIISGRYDGYLRTFLKSMNQSAVHDRLGAIYFCFEHEANEVQNHPWLGTIKQFREAWDHIHRLAARAHLNWQQGGRLHWVMIMTHWAYLTKRHPDSPPGMGKASAYFPGNREVDLVAADGYDNIGCAPNYTHATPFKVFDSIVTWAHQHGGIPMFVAEWGASAKVADAQRRFIQAMPKFVTGNPQIAGALYWDRAGSSRCTYIVNRHPASVVALRTMGHLAAMQGRARVA